MTGWRCGDAGNLRISFGEGCDPFPRNLEASKGMGGGGSMRTFNNCGAHGVIGLPGGGVLKSCKACTAEAPAQKCRVFCLSDPRLRPLFPLFPTIERHVQLPRIGMLVALETIALEKCSKLCNYGHMIPQVFGL